MWEFLEILAAENADGYVMSIKAMVKDNF